MRSSPSRLQPRFRLRAKLGFLAATATLAVLASTAWLTLRVFRGQLLDLLAESSSNQSDVLRVVLEEQMTGGDLKPLRRVVDDLGHEPNIVWVGVVNAQGRVRISSDPRALDLVTDKSSAECRVCHDRPPGDRLRSVTLLRDSGEVLRTTTPLLNRPACQRCHGDEQRINGMLIVDRSLDPLHKAILSSRAQVVAGSAAAVLALLLTLGPAVEWLVLARLRRIREAARELGRGNLQSRAPEMTSDELGDVARDFNAMADALSSALARLGGERQQLEELVNGISDGVVLLDVGLKLVTANRAFQARLPAGAPATAGTTHATVARAAGFEAADCASSVAERALASEQLEKEIVRVPGEDGDRVEEIYAQPLRDGGGRITAVIEVWRDITHRTELEAGLEQSERLAAIGMLASGVAHEVGNPLAAIATAVEGLLRRMEQPGGSDPAEVKEYLEIVRRQVFRCRDVTERLLGFARIPTRELSTVDAAEAAREVLALVVHQARAQKVEVRSMLATPAPVVAEALLLEQVFLNLVVNALQAMPSGGVLTVAAREVRDAVVVTFEDTGPGIPERVRRSLFRAFRRHRPDGQGTGLGLFLSEALLRRCDATISAESEPGKGAVFAIRLKRAASADSERAAGI
jgi:signal transduction histidine kinase